MKKVRSNQFSVFPALFFTLFSIQSVMAASLAEDKVELTELSHRYAWGIDTMDRDMLTNVFTQDATVHYVDVGSDKPLFDVKLKTFEKIYQWLDENIGHRKGPAALPGHFLSNHLIDIQDDTATMTYYMHNRSMAAGGVYYVTAERTADGWRIKSLKLEEQLWRPEHYKGVHEGTRMKDQ